VTASWLSHSSGDDEDFGPGAALVLSLFAVFLLVAALSWRDMRRSQAFLPTTLVNISESDAGQGYLEAGRTSLRPAVEATIRDVLARTVAAAHQRYQRRERGHNHLQVIGYASPEGRNNQQLASARAMAVRDYLVTRLSVPAECIVVASYADSHSELLQQWLKGGHSQAAFRALPTADAQRQALSASAEELARERRVVILGAFHSDSTCRLDLVAVTRQ